MFFKSASDTSGLFIAFMIPYMPNSNERVFWDGRKGKRK